MRSARLRGQAGNGASTTIVAIFAIVVIVIILLLAYGVFAGHWFGAANTTTTVNTTVTASP